MISKKQQNGGGDGGNGECLFLYVLLQTVGNANILTTTIKAVEED